MSTRSIFNHYMQGDKQMAEKGGKDSVRGKLLHIERAGFNPAPAEDIPRPPKKTPAPSAPEDTKADGDQNKEGESQH